MHGFQHFLCRVGACYRQQIRVMLFYDITLCTQTTRNDDLAVLIHSFTNGVQGLGDSVIDKTTGVYNDQIRIIVLCRQFITLDSKLGQYSL